jgi:hypothetical protein
MAKRSKRLKDEFSYVSDYPIEEVWNTDNTIAQLLVPRLKAFKELDKHGYPSILENGSMRKWNQVIQKMIDAFELKKYPCVLSEEDELSIKEGLALFCRYFTDLWD